MNGWDIDDLVPGAPTELDAPTLTVPAAAEVYARLLAMTADAADDHRIVRALAARSSPLDHPGGLIGEAADIADCLDHSGRDGAGHRAAAESFEAALRALPPLDLPRALADALTG